MEINVDEIVKKMKFNDTRVKNLNNGWNIKALNNYTNFEVFNDEENTIFDCPSIENLRSIISQIKEER